MSQEHRSPAQRAGDVGRNAQSTLGRIRDRHPGLDRLMRAGTRYSEHHGDHYAAAITYFSVLALVPLLMVAFAVAGFVLFNNQQLLDQARTAITEAAPTPDLSSTLNEVVTQAIDQRTVVGILGLLTALYSGLGWMTNLRNALTAQWNQSFEQPPFVTRLVRDLLALVGLGLALVVSIGLTVVGSAFASEILDLFGVERTAAARASLWVVSLLLVLAANWLVFTWVLAKLPRKPVTLRSAMWGGLVAAVGIELLKQLGGVYLQSVARSPAGAAFGSVLGLLVLIYLVARFLLFVAAWTASATENLAHTDAAGHQPPAPPVSTELPVALSRTDDRTGLGGNRLAAGMFGVGVLTGLGAGRWWRRRG
ncbi:inner membrane protein YhjD [Actinoalloteichus sp. AHMU CJ021]|uniref:Membrane protein n=1 Tax=Actinoalloteichus caeruleus DSM 43889 TaxID=1120930 RepID=A0ABT1JM28_ACTCY|nr:inner membrane protein YhjD [Actinoalloteichus caeruleus]AUS79302.1 inner membrane protein YhjD [Actinoalloteichus sp. AHMU CJ021]MCP2333577.1 membrane protein [Actinoalloteichus caeruleus DSM 43889]